MGNTEAWRVRQLPEEVFALQKPLYPLNTYTDKQVARAHNTHSTYCRYLSHTQIHLPHTDTHEAFYYTETNNPTNLCVEPEKESCTWNIGYFQKH